MLKISQVIIPLDTAIAGSQTVKTSKVRKLACAKIYRTAHVKANWLLLTCLSAVNAQIAAMVWSDPTKVKDADCGGKAWSRC